MTKFHAAAVASLTILSALTNLASAQTVRYVRATAPAGGNGLSWATAYNTLQPAIAAAVAGDEIWVAAGSYSATTGMYAFAMKSGVSTFGGFAGTEVERIQRDPSQNVTNLTGSNLRTVVAFLNVNSAVLDGFRISGGRGHGDVSTPTGTATDICPGGGVSIQSSTVTVSNCQIENNFGGPIRAGVGNWAASDGDGGGALVLTSSVHFVNCSFRNNRVSNAEFDGCGGGTPFIYGGAGSGGAIASQSSQLTLDNCIFDNNRASSGISGIACSAVISNGENGGSGGAIYALGGTLQINRTHFLRNFAGGGGNSGLFHGSCASSPGLPGNGGAIHSTGPIVVRNSTFTANGTSTNGPTCNANTGGFGSAIRCTSAATITNCLFYANAAPGTLVAGMGTLQVGSGSQVANSIFWANSGDAGQTQGMQLGNFSPTLLASCIVQNLSPASGSNRNSNPLFLNPLGPDNTLGTADDRFDLAITSPAIDAGINSRYTGGALDLAGNQRFFDVLQVPNTGSGTSPIIDIGPYEFSRCPADLDNGTGTGIPDNAVTIDDLLYFLVAFESGTAAADLDNGNATGVLDNAVTIDDLLFFLVRFEIGC